MKQDECPIPRGEPRFLTRCRHYKVACCGSFLTVRKHEGFRIVELSRDRAYEETSFQSQAWNFGETLCICIASVVNIVKAKTKEYALHINILTVQKIHRVNKANAFPT